MGMRIERRGQCIDRKKYNRSSSDPKDGRFILWDSGGLGTSPFNPAAENTNFVAGRIAYSRNSSIEGKEIAFKWAMQIYEGRREKGKGREKEKEKKRERRRGMGCGSAPSPTSSTCTPNRRRITCTRESCYANTRQHSAALTAWRAENESPIFAEDREKDGGRLY